MNTAELTARSSLSLRAIRTAAAAIGRSAENGSAALALLAMGALPVLELALRTFFETGIPGSTAYVQNLTLWVGFLGAMLASRENRHLSLSTGSLDLPTSSKNFVNAFRAAVCAAVAAGLSWACLDFVRAEMHSPAGIAGWLPIWAVESILPFAFAIMTVRFISGADRWWTGAAALLGIALAALFGWIATPYASLILWPGLALLALAGLAGAPIFVVLGGSALLLFLAEGVPIAAIPVETYTIVVSPSIPMIPLFTLTGYILAEGKSSQRLVRLFRALFGWMPGGLAIAATLVCAFFTTFTGASSVTILALGGLLLPALLQNGYRENFSVGLLTATGSLGLLFPPSLAVILYGVVAHVPIPDLFRAGLIPGLFMIAAVSIFGVREGLHARIPRSPFRLREAAAALWESKWEVLLPIVALSAIFGGYCTLVEAAALTVVYALVVETVILREIDIARDLPRVLLQCATLIGGIFAILGVAMGLTNYLVDAQIPMKAAAWVQTHVESRILFLLALNVFLLVVGCLMDIFSAIVIVVPLILPISQEFGVHPLHLGMIFLANLELGYLTPPVGMNLFLASYRFDKPLVRVSRDALPFLGLLLLVVLLITYFPLFTVGVADALGGR